MMPLCDQTVTVYRKDARLVVENCFYRYTRTQDSSNLGSRQERTFLLVVPAGGYAPEIGDRIYPGIGPVTVEWETFLPCTVEGLGEVTYVTPWYFDGRLHHFEAGRK